MVVVSSSVSFVVTLSTYQEDVFTSAQTSHADCNTSAEKVGEKKKKESER